MGDQVFTDDLTGEDFTFDRTLANGDLAGGGYCRICATQARMSGSSEPGGETWSRVGVCQTQGCRGYTGHPPAGRPQGDDHDNSGGDEVPLLFSPLGSSTVSHSSQQELGLVDHCHGKEQGQEASRAASRQLAIALVLCAIFVGGEVLGGVLSGSLAIMGDAVHMFSDLASFGISLFALWLSEKRPRKRRTFGYYRAQVLGALATLVIIWVVTGVLVYLAVERIQTRDFEIHDTAMCIVATCAVIFNVFLAITLHGGVAACRLPHGHSHGGGGGHQHLGHGHADTVTDGAGRQINIRAALIHVLGDFLQSIGVLISSLLIKFFGESFKLADPVCTLVFACIVLGTTVPVLKDTVAILMESTPASLDYDTVLADLEAVREVQEVHSLQLWSLTADVPCLTAHLTTRVGADQERLRAEACRVLRNKHGIFRTTLQVELHQAQVMADCQRCQPLTQ